jgi:hypothetical protein
VKRFGLVPASMSKPKQPKNNLLSFSILQANQPINKNMGDYISAKDLKTAARKYNKKVKINTGKGATKDTMTNALISAGEKIDMGSKPKRSKRSAESLAKSKRKAQAKKNKL